jgi:hypothetical protein
LQVFYALLLICAAEPCERETATRVIGATFVNAYGRETPCTDWLAYQLEHFAGAPGPITLRFKCERNNPE